MKIELIKIVTFMLLAFVLGYVVGVYEATSNRAVKYSPVVTTNSCTVEVPRM